MDAGISAAVAALRGGGVVAYPTEAVWGLGCDPHDEAAVRELFRLKQRPAGVGVLLIGSSFAQLSGYVGTLPEAALERTRASWPGASTWVFPASARVPRWIRGDHAGVALRVTAHPVAAALCEAFGGALVSTSANRHGEPPMRDAADVRAAFGAELAAVVDGALGGLDRPTPIRDALSGETLRA
ncbi:MAG: Sua5/YciO/YrdC/YwlC family protein [Xanthomonadales bacterium]|nr:Sua5/YciO/YrdC/YwlC family protein [Xanthomonadales bacterium]